MLFCTLVCASVHTDLQCDLQQHKSPNFCRENWCYNQTTPFTNETYKQYFPRTMISVVERNIQKMRNKVKYLNITHLSEYRKDAHTSVYTTRQGNLLTLDQQRQPNLYADCSHWCLPGLPDTWNVLLFASLMGTPSNVSQSYSTGDFVLSLLILKLTLRTKQN